MTGFFGTVGSHLKIKAAIIRKITETSGAIFFAAKPTPACAIAGI
jgi:hypothetical protein